MCKDISSTMSVPEAGPHTPCTRLSAPWTPSSRRQHLPTPTATSSLWTDGAPTWAAPSPTERHPTGQYRLLERNDPFVDVANPAAFIEKAETETRLKRHTPASGMPHPSAPDATLQHVPSVAFPPAKCGFGRGETIHV